MSFVVARIPHDGDCGDLFNFGSGSVAGNDVVTGAFGLKCKPSSQSELGIAWELPLTERRDVCENRLAFDWIWRYWD